MRHVKAGVVGKVRLVSELLYFKHAFHPILEQFDEKINADSIDGWMFL